MATTPQAVDSTGAAITLETAVGRADHSGYYPYLYSAKEASAAHPGTTAAETELTPASGQGSATVTPAMMYAGAVIPFSAALRFTCDDDGTETLKVKGYLGGLSGQAIFDTGALVVNEAEVTDSPMLVTGYVKIRTEGASGTGVAVGVIHYQIGAGTPVALPFVTPFTDFNTTTSKAFAISGDHGGTTDAADTVTLEDLVVG